jgi:hypothetical protein
MTITLTTAQRNIARDIIAEAWNRNMGAQGAIIGIMTALAESNLTNVDHGDAPGPSSRGVFQQMPSWGDLDCRMTPACAAVLFFERLQSTPWLAEKPWVAAQRVQQSEFVAGFTGLGSDGTEGWNYLQRYDDAQQIYIALGNPAPPVPPTGGPIVTPEQYAALTQSITALSAQLATARADLDKLIHAQAAMIVNTTLPYLQQISNKVGG